MKDTTIQDLLNDSIAQELFNDLGIIALPNEEKIQLLETLGETLMLHVTLELSKKIPDEQLPEFRKLIGSGKMDTMRAFCMPFVGNLDEFVSTIVGSELKKLRRKSQL